eukprot:TRINITY_DN9720_c0_g1_i1.p1 TRINITY_DN9720_c0_g1~~TRINITY_DN9720_c0_g1_i1.p1  ORF type:complete len:132 (-),score=26.22 TRINITY_DN9720_c0_g1_i1:62-457(-)
MSRDYAGEIVARQSAITSALNTRDSSRILEAICDNPPYGCTDATLLAQNLRNVCQIFTNTSKKPDVEKAVASATPDQLDVLFKYVYAAMANAQDTNESAAYFTWHAALLEKAGGLGSIVRVIADKNNRVSL